MASVSSYSARRMWARPTVTTASGQAIFRSCVTTPNSMCRRLSNTTPAALPEVMAWGESTLSDLASLFLENLSGYSLSSAEKSQYEKQVLDWLYLVHKGKLLESWEDISPCH